MASSTEADRSRTSNSSIIAGGQTDGGCIMSRESAWDDNDDEAKDDRRTPAQKVRQLLTRGIEEELTSFRSLSSHILYIQLDVLCHFADDTFGWKEISRWLKYEEKVEAGGRWSKPHVTTASLHALLELRRALDDERSTVVDLDIDVGSGSMRDVMEAIGDVTARQQMLSDFDAKRFLQILLCPHKHRHRPAKKAEKPALHKKLLNAHEGKGSYKNDVLSQTNSHHGRNNYGRNSITVATGSKIGQSSRRRSLVRKEGKELWTICTSYPKGATPQNLMPYQPNSQLMRKITLGTEGASILIGHIDFLEKPILGFFRLRSACILDDLTEVSVLIRFIVLVLGPSDRTSIMEYSEIGRALAVLFSDKVFCEVSYKAMCRKDLMDGIDEFMDGLTVLPPSIWDPNTRLEPPSATRTLDDIWCRLNDVDRHEAKFDCLQSSAMDATDSSLFRSGKLFGGLKHDVKRRYHYYLSDIRDGLHFQCLAAIVFLYFACITPIVTFGGLMGQQTDGYMGTMEMLVSGAVCGAIFSLFAGQPLIIVGATGPLLVFETIVYQLCKEHGMDFLSTRFWIGAWVFLFLILLVALDLSSLVCYITRFTEESFTVLISVIFIYEAISKLGRVWYNNPIGLAPSRFGHGCHCVLLPYTENSTYENSTQVHDLSHVDYASHTSLDSALLNWSRNLSEDCITYRHSVIVRAGCLDRLSCLADNWTLVGAGCEMNAVTKSIPDVFLLSCVLLCGTFAFAMFFRAFRTTTYFPTIVRRVAADFSVFMAVIFWTGVDFFFGLQTPKLLVPSEFKPTRANRGWLVNPLVLIETGHWWMVLATAVPGILATVLIFLDQQITAVIVNRKEHKLKKGHGYHLDLFVLSFLVAFCSVFGLPWFVAATVRAITHVRSLICESEAQAPGDKPKMLGIREQRVTGVGIHVLIGLSAFFTSVLKYVPMPVLYGVFLYMGCTSLVGVQFVERIQILFMPVKFQPDYVYLRHVKTSHVHCFTILQLICSVTMWIVKSIKAVSIAFPLMLVVLVGVRKLMDLLFSQRDLFWLDNLLPEETRRKQEDVTKASSDGKIEDKKEEEIGLSGQEPAKPIENDVHPVKNDRKLELKLEKQMEPYSLCYAPIP